MKKIILAAFLAAASLSYAVEFEFKAGFDAFRDYTQTGEGHNPVKTYPGATVGGEVLFLEDTKLRVGLGGEWKTKLHSSGGVEGHNTFPVYAVAKYDFTDIVYGVLRGGYAFAHDSGADYVDSMDGGWYAAAGAGMHFLDEQINVELLYEGMEYDYDSEFHPADGYLHGLSLKLGVKFGGKKAEKTEPIVVEKISVVEPAPVVVPVVVELGPEGGFKAEALFDFDSAAVHPEGTSLITSEVNKLVGYSGNIYVIGHTDSIGREEYNQELSEERAANVKVIIDDVVNSDEIQVYANGRGESEPIATNDTEIGRAENRRVEIFWEPEVK